MISSGFSRGEAAFVKLLGEIVTRSRIHGGAMTKHEKYILKKLANGQCDNCKNLRDNHTALCSACRNKRLAKYVPRGRHMQATLPSVANHIVDDNKMVATPTTTGMTPAATASVTRTEDLSRAPRV